VGFERTISAGERPQTNALDCAATGTGVGIIMTVKIEVVGQKPVIRTLFHLQISHGMTWD
jgi:hypothetical protein